LRYCYAIPSHLELPPPNPGKGSCCGNGVIQVLYTLRDECGNEAYASYQIIVADNVDPEFVTQVSDLVLTCEETVPAPAMTEASVQ
jgi:hypothetical protein